MVYLGPYQAVDKMLKHARLFRNGSDYCDPALHKIASTQVSLRLRVLFFVDRQCGETHERLVELLDDICQEHHVDKKMDSWMITRFTTYPH